MLRGASAEALAELSTARRAQQHARSATHATLGAGAVRGRGHPARRRGAAAGPDRQLGRGREQGGSGDRRSSAPRSRTRRRLDLSRTPPRRRWTSVGRPGRRPRAAGGHRHGALGRRQGHRGRRRAVRRPADDRRQPGAARRPVRPDPVARRTAAGCSPDCWATRSSAATGTLVGQAVTRGRGTVDAALEEYLDARRGGARRSRSPRCTPPASSAADEQRAARRQRSATSTARDRPAARRGRPEPDRRAAGRDRRRRHRRHRGQQARRRPAPDRRLTLASSAPPRPSGTPIGKRQGQHDGAFDPSGGDPRRAPEVRRRLQAVRGQQGGGRHRRRGR